MINLRKASLLAVFGVMITPAAFAGNHSAMHDVVTDARGDVVLNTHANCVVSQWPSTVDECTSARLARTDVLNMLSTEDRTVYFDFNKSTLNSREKAKLDEISSMILASKEVDSIDIVGFADKMGDAGYNKALSKRRAYAVKKYLAAKGLRTSNVSVSGMGAKNSLTSCSDGDRSARIACLAADRRVEIRLNMMH